MVNKKILYILATFIIIIIITLIVLNNIKINYQNQQIDSQKGDSKVFMTVTKSNSTYQKNNVKKYLFRFWNLCLTENTEGIKAICSNYTKQIPKSINSFSIDQLYITNGVSTCFVKTSLNSERYYYAILTKTEGFAIIEITRDEFETYKQNYDEKYKDYNIEKNAYNSTTISDDIEISFYMNIFTNNLKNNIDRAYKELKTEYALKRFGNIENFKKYFQDNKETLLNIKVNNSSSFEDQVGNKKIIFFDKYLNVYIMEIDLNNNFYMQLDDYTLDNDIFNANYENSTNMDKVLLNCEKFFKMINTKNYEAAYNVLDENFKQTYFKTQEDFEKYVKNKLFSYNKAKYEEYRQPIDSVHALKVTLTDATGVSKEKHELNIVMMLKEKRDFIMSFEVKE